VNETDPNNARRDPAAIPNAAHAAADGPPEGGLPPWVDPEIQQQIEWRDGDIVVSVPVKSGTTWTMNIVHQLRSGGDPDLDDIYIDVPWLELVPAPGTTRESLVAGFNAMPAHPRRAFKTHSAPGLLPYFGPGSEKHVQYVVVVRNPEEAVASFHPFIASHSDEWFALWEMEKGEIVPAEFATFFEQFAKPMIGPGIFGFIAAWWPLRHQSNVLLMHFSDMKRDHEGSVRRISEFLGFEPTAEQWATVLECTSFPWMKRHENKFELAGVTDVRILNPGAMVRKGRTGAAREDGVTPEIAAEIAALGREFVEDEAALEWAYRGGALP
jgi:aryl sulfotransferase